MQPKEKTRAEQVTDYANGIKTNLISLMYFCREAVKNQSAKIYNSPFTTDEILAEFGTDFLTLCQNAVAFSQLLNSQAQPADEQLPLVAPVELDWSAGDGSAVTKK